MPLEVVKHLWEQGLAWGQQLAQQHPYLIFSECVVGGTTTALAVLKGLGIAADRSLSGEFPSCL